MTSPLRTRDQHLACDGRPKRILTLDGGGLRGILTLGILEQLEKTLATRHHAGEAFRLHHYFDLVAGTSTGAIIASLIALGWSVGEITEKYFELGRDVFERSPFRLGLLRAKYDKNALAARLQKLLGAETQLDSDRLLTGLLIISKRLNTGSVWPLANNPRGRYFRAREGHDFLPNGEYLLWQVVRASTAAPGYFEGEDIAISAPAGRNPEVGHFVDGGVSPHNNPALQALMYATIDGYRLCWPSGAGQLLLVSVGTGSRDPSVNPMKVTAGHALQCLVAMMDDCGSLVETMLQWLSNSRSPTTIDRELGDLGDDLAGSEPMLTYLRYNVDLRPDRVQELLGNEAPDAKVLASLSEMDAPENMPILSQLGKAGGKQQIQSHHFPARFDLHG